MKNKTQFASISLDLDDKWTYLKTHGNPEWEDYPSYLDIVVPRILKFLEKKQLNITFFIVGKDASITKNHEILNQISSAGHDIANHSFHHDPWLHLYSEQKIHEELSLAEASIMKATGKKTTGFRGPGFSHSAQLLKALIERDYMYDASTLPNFLSPLARTYFLSTSKLSREEKNKRKKLFGKFSDGFRPNKTYQWEHKGKSLLEIPVTTFPGFKVPIHASYIIYFSIYSASLARFYFKSAVNLCKITGVQPSILLHPLDFIGIDDTKDLVFFPAMQHKSNWKIKILEQVIQVLQSQFDLVDMNKFAVSEISKNLLKHKTLVTNS